MGMEPGLIPKLWAFFLSIAIALSLIHTPAWLILAVPFGFMAYTSWRFYYRRPWCIYHFTYRRAFFRSMEFEAGLADFDNRALNLENVWNHWLAEIRPMWDEKKRKIFINGQIIRCVNFEDQEQLENEFRKRYINLSEKLLQETMEKTKAVLSSPSEFSIAGHIIAGLIGEMLGNDMRMEYLFELVTGKVAIKEA